MPAPYTTKQCQGSTPLMEFTHCMLNDNNGKNNSNTGRNKTNVDNNDNMLDGPILAPPTLSQVNMEVERGPLYDCYPLCRASDELPR